MRLFRRPTKKRQSMHRPIFGFPCDRGLQLLVRATAARLQVPIYPFAEHLLQLGLYHVLPALKDKALEKPLQDHLRAQHLLQKDLEDEIDGYDGRVMTEIEK